MPSFNNQIEDCKIVRQVDVDFAAHAASMGALTRKVESLTDLEDAIRWAKTTDRTTVLVVKTDAYTWTPGDAWWDVGVPEVSTRASVKKARKDARRGAEEAAGGCLSETASAGDPFDLARFVVAQAPVYRHVLDELRRGRKESHWMWFIFPQIAGLGASDMARRYAIASADEACAYLAHPLLGQRLLECTRLLLTSGGQRIELILGNIDALKFCSSMTLFAHVSPEVPEFHEALGIFFGGKRDARTTALL